MVLGITSSRSHPSSEQFLVDVRPPSPSGSCPLSTQVQLWNGAVLDTGEFEKVFWTYKPDHPDLSCNGIVVANSRIGVADTPVPYLKVPHISVFDWNGYLPLDLRRTNLQERSLPFERELFSSITDDLLAHAIVDGPTSCTGRWLRGAYEGFDTFHWAAGIDWARWAVAANGFILNDRHLLAAFDPKIIIVAIGGKAGYQEWGDSVRGFLPPDALLLSSLPGGLAGTNPKIKGLFSSLIDKSLYVPGVSHKRGSAYIPKALVEKIATLRPGTKVSGYLNAVGRAHLQNGWYCHVDHKAGLGSLTDRIASIPVDEADPTMFYVLAPEAWNKAGVSDVVAARWISLIGTSPVPFDATAREELERQALGALQEAIGLRRELRQQLESEREEAALIADGETSDT